MLVHRQQSPPSTCRVLSGIDLDRTWALPRQDIGTLPIIPLQAPAVHYIGIEPMTRSDTKCRIDKALTTS